MLEIVQVGCINGDIIKNVIQATTHNIYYIFEHLKLIKQQTCFLYKDRLNLNY